MSRLPSLLPAALLACLLLSGCAQHRLTVPVPNHQDQFTHKSRSNALAWGAIEDPKAATRCGQTNVMSEIRVRTSFWQALATVVTLGFWQPAEVEYRCSKLPGGGGTIQP